MFGNDFKYLMNLFFNVVDMMGKDGDIMFICVILKIMVCLFGEIMDF